MAATSNSGVYVVVTIVGLIAVAALFMSFKGAGNKDNSNVGGNGNGTVNTGAVPCKENDPGYNINGILDSNCGTPKCNPNNYGYNMAGFPDPDCGFGRIGR